MPVKITDNDAHLVRSVDFWVEAAKTKADDAAVDRSEYHKEIPRKLILLFKVNKNMVF